MGCTDHRSKWIGTWKGESEGVPNSQDPVLANTLRQVELQINADATYSLRWGPLPVSGNISFGGEKSTLIPKKLMDQPFESQPKDVQASHQGVQLEFLNPNEIKIVDTNNGRPSVVLTKQTENSN